MSVYGVSVEAGSAPECIDWIQKAARAAKKETSRNKRKAKAKKQAAVELIKRQGKARG